MDLNAEAGAEAGAEAEAEAEAEYNQGLINVQIECIETNNQSLEVQYEQMSQMNQYLLQQQQVYTNNQALIQKQMEQMNEYQMNNNYLQQQVYYHRTELDRLVEQMQQNDEKIRTQQATIHNNMFSFGKVFQSEPYYANQLLTAGIIVYPPN